MLVSIGWCTKSVHLTWKMGISPNIYSQVIQRDLFIPYSWGSLEQLKGSLNHPKKGHKELPGLLSCFFSTLVFSHPAFFRPSGKKWNRSWQDARHLRPPSVGAECSEVSWKANVIAMVFLLFGLRVLASIIGVPTLVATSFLPSHFGRISWPLLWPFHSRSDSICDLFIPKRWRSLNPSKGSLKSLNHPKKVTSRIAR